MTKLEIFDDIVKSMKTDASCCKDEYGADPQSYRAKISEDMDDEAFLFVVSSYLATFHVIFHVGFGMTNRGIIPFTVQRYQDTLYVCEAQAHSRLSVGDRIIEIDGYTVEDFARLHEDMLYGESEERQSQAWELLLGFAGEVAAVKVDTGETEKYPITLDGIWGDGIRYACKRLREDVVYLRLKDFQDEVAIHKLYADNDAILRGCKYLIIDVRDNGGGCNTAFFPLLKFCLPEGKTLRDLPAGIYDGDMEINYSERSCDSRLKMYEEYLKQDLPEDTRTILQTMIDEARQNRGKGFIVYPSDDLELPMTGLATPQKVYIITDHRCGSSGDAFVDMMRKSDKVTVVGRPTLGIQDFSNCTGTAYGNFYFTYPTSRSLYLDQKIQMRNHGVPVDVYIPWTPEHLTRDVDLERVMELIDHEK